MPLTRSTSPLSLRSAIFALAFVLAAAAPAAAEKQSPQARAERPTQQNAAPERAPEHPAEHPPTQPTTPPNPLPPPATTSHVLELPGRTLRFKAIASAVRLSDAQSGDPLADVAALAFLLDGADPAKRPIAFVINGGPGAGSAWLNLGALGPWRLPLEGAAPSPSAQPIAIDNADTWLDFTDLVFIDPPGTGYSRILAEGEKGRRQFYSIGGDIDSLAVAIRKWLAANDRLESPKFFVGESYGGFRGPKLARRLQDEEGIGLRGLILVSPVLDFAWFDGANNLLAYVTRLPSQAAAARGLDGADGRAPLADVETYALGPYLSDLLRGERDPQALARMSEEVAKFTKLDPALVRSLGGRIDIATFARERNRAEGKVSSIYDARVDGFDPTPHAANSDYSDPILDAVKTRLAGAMADITANRLGWRVEARYEILNEQVNRQWKWGDGRGRPEAISDLKRALAIDPQLRVLIAHGLTDEVTPYFTSQLLIDQVPPLGDPNRLRLKVYGGGHMLYLQDKSRAALREDARKLIEGK